MPQINIVVSSVFLLPTRNRGFNVIGKDIIGGKRVCNELMDRQFPRKWTQMTFEKPSFQNCSKFDDSGVEVEVIQALERRIPNHFLVIALIQQLCSLYIHDNEEKCAETFKVICEQLARMKILPSFALHKDFEAVREKYITAFHGILLDAAGGDDNSLNLFPFGDNRTSLISRCPATSRQVLVHVKQRLEHNTSRYKEEFKQLERLGKGGFGSVYKVTNKLDSREYAVKKVHLSERDLSNCLKVLREVKVLACLRHPNVVGYQSAWLEFVSNENVVSSGLPRTSTHPDRLVDLDDQSAGFSNIFQRLDSQDSDSSHIVFQNSETSVGGDGSRESKEHKGHSSHSPVKLRGGLLSTPRHNFISVNSVGIHKSSSDANLGRFTSPKSYRNSHLHNHKPRNGHFVNEEDGSNSGDSVGGKSLGIVLFIQMELCAITLRHWLFEQNLEIFKTGGQVSNEYNTNIFKQIVNGVKYIHSQGLIHRDLKPSNIFLHRDKRYNGSYEYQVKIGDFGLARADLFRSDPPNGNEFSSMIEPLSPLFPCGSPTSSNFLGQTLGVGTCTYASPEQLHNKSYDSKVDIYSLGIILYEFYQPFNTEMEKHKSIKEIRKEIMPEDFKKLWPDQSALILRMMAKNPHDRPTAEEILSMDIMSEKSKCHAELLKKLENEQKENEFLREKIRELELELTRKDERIIEIQTEKVNCERCKKFN